MRGVDHVDEPSRYRRGADQVWAGLGRGGTQPGLGSSTSGLPARAPTHGKVLDSTPGDEEEVVVHAQPRVEAHQMVQLHLVEQIFKIRLLLV